MYKDNDLRRFDPVSCSDLGYVIIGHDHLIEPFCEMIVRAGAEVIVLGDASRIPAVDLSKNSIETLLGILKSSNHDLECLIVCADSLLSLRKRPASYSS